MKASRSVSSGDADSDIDSRGGENKHGDGHTTQRTGHKHSTQHTGHRHSTQHTGHRQSTQHTGHRHSQQHTGQRHSQQQPGRELRHAGGGRLGQEGPVSTRAFTAATTTAGSQVEGYRGDQIRRRSVTERGYSDEGLRGYGDAGLRGYSDEGLRGYGDAGPSAQGPAVWQQRYQHESSVREHQYERRDDRELNQGRPFVNRNNFTVHKYPFHLDHVAPEDDELANRTLFVGNLDADIPVDELQSLFERFGVVEEIRYKSSTTSKANPFAFIKFFNLNQAHAAKMEMTGQYIGRFRCKIGYGRVTPTNCVWVGGIGDWLTKQELKGAFSRFGRLVTFQWPRDADYAYVVFESRDAASTAVQHMRGFVFPGTNVRLRTDFGDVNQLSPSSPQRHRHKGSGKSSGRHQSSGGKSSSRDDGLCGRNRSDNGSVDRRGMERKKRKSESDRSPGMSRESRSSSSSAGSVRDGSRGGHSNKRKKCDNLKVDDSASDSSRTTDCDKESSVAGSQGSEGDDVKDATTVDVLRRSTKVVWTGLVTLKNNCYSVSLHLVSGEASLAETLLPNERNTFDKSRRVLKITQRLRMDEPKLDEVKRRIAVSGPRGCCVLLAVASQNNSNDSSGLKEGKLCDLVTYLKDKKAAGLLTLPAEDNKAGQHQQESGLLHLFPPCKFVQEYLVKEAPSLRLDYNRDTCMVAFLVRLKK